MDIWDSGNPWDILTLKAWWPVSVLCWFQDSECIQTCNSRWSWQALFLQRVTGRCSAGMYELIEIPHAVIHHKAKTNIWCICFFVHLTLVLLLCWWLFSTTSNSFWVSSSGYELGVHDWACATAGSLHKRCTFPTGFCDALHLINNCSDMSADVEPAAVALQYMRVQVRKQHDFISDWRHLYAICGSHAPFA